jgi:hypothetical protein
MTVLPSRENVEWDDRDATRQTQSLALPAPVACLVSDGGRAGSFSAFWQVPARPDVGGVPAAKLRFCCNCICRLM